MPDMSVRKPGAHVITHGADSQLKSIIGGIMALFNFSKRDLRDEPKIDPDFYKCTKSDCNDLRASYMAHPQYCHKHSVEFSEKMRKLLLKDTLEFLNLKPK